VHYIHFVSNPQSCHDVTIVNCRIISTNIADNKQPVLISGIVLRNGVQPCSFYETRLSLSVFKRLLSLLASIVLATLPLADDESMRDVQ